VGCLEIRTDGDEDDAHDHDELDGGWLALDYWSSCKYIRKTYVFTFVLVRGELLLSMLSLHI